MSDTKPSDIHVVALGHGRYRVTRGTSQRIAFAAAARDVWVFLDGRAYVVANRDRPTTRARADGDEALMAPMPAAVLAVHIRPGDRVQRNDVLVVLEAMKMELPIRAPRDGMVKSVGCAVGELVQAGTTLLELHEERGGDGSPRQ